jgi:hypothetical protein
LALNGRILVFIPGFAAVIAILICSSSIVFAQGRTTCAIGGNVKDEIGTPLSGAIVEIASTALIGRARISTADEYGRFRFSEVPPGRYEITVRLSGFKTVRIQQYEISVGMTVEIPIRMSIYAGKETVSVLAESNTIDPATSAVPTILRREFIEGIPSDRDTSHILNFAPGINIESAYGGGEESGNSYEIDGVNISDPLEGSPFSIFSYSLVDEVELIGLGAPAEYGQFTGVVFNTITKSGSNDFSGSAEFFYTGEELTSKHSEFELVSTIETHTEEAFQMGGPIQKDKLWYFAAAQYSRDLSTEGGPVETLKDPRAFLKLTWQTNDNNTLDGWIQWAHTKIIGRNGDAFTPIEATTGEDNPEIVGNLSWKSVWSDNSVVSVKWSGYNGRRDFDPYNGFLIPGRIDAQTGIASANAAQFAHLERTRNQINASLSHHTNNMIAGYHDFKFGAEIERSRVSDRYGFPGGAFFSDNEGPEEDPSTGEEDFFTLATYGGGYQAQGINQRLSVFLQDSWRITSQFTINPGVRLDLNRGRVGSGTVFKTNPLALRVGFAWDIKGEGQSLFRAHYGRYYEALYASFYYYLDPGAFLPQVTQRIFNTSGFTDTITSTQGQKYAIDPDIKQPMLDQYILGIDHQLPFGFVLSGTLVYRRNHNLIETVSRDGIFVPVRGIVPGSGQEITLYDHLNPGTDVLIYTNPAGLNRTYRALILAANKPLGGKGQIYASYVYSKTRGNIDNLGFDESGIGANTPFFDGHFLDTPNSLVNAQGRLTHDQTHQIKLQGNWIVPSLHLSFSTNYTYHSGDTWTPRSDCLITDDGNGVIGDGILDCHEFPQGPVLYFAETRGSRRLKARNEIDLRVEWQYKFVNLGVLGLQMDIFNLFNQIRPTEVESIADEELGQPATLNFPRNIRFGIIFSW